MIITITIISEVSYFYHSRVKGGGGCRGVEGAECVCVCERDTFIQSLLSLTSDGFHVRRE